jgi:hypothetical protein
MENNYEHFTGVQLITNMLKTLGITVVEEDTKNTVQTILDNSNPKVVDSTTFLNFKDNSVQHFKIQKPTNVIVLGGYEKKKYSNFWSRIEIPVTPFLVAMLEQVFTKYNLMEKVINTIYICDDDFSKIFINPNLIYNFEESQQTFEVLKKFNSKEFSKNGSALKSIINRVMKDDEDAKIKDICYLLPDAIICNNEDEDSVSLSFKLNILVKQRKGNKNAMNFDDKKTCFQFVKYVLNNVNDY